MVTMNHLPAEIVELVIEFACCTKFVLVDESPVYTYRYVENPWQINGAPSNEDWYWIYWPNGPDGWWDYKDYDVESYQLINDLVDEINE
jgi:hypothetical protein